MHCKKQKKNNKKRLFAACCFKCANVGSVPVVAIPEEDLCFLGTRKLAICRLQVGQPAYGVRHSNLCEPLYVVPLQEQGRGIRAYSRRKWVQIIGAGEEEQPHAEHTDPTNTFLQIAAQASSLVWYSSKLFFSDCVDKGLPCRLAK